jgi:beta-carotene/zeaxanthin 4-ketolase
MTRRVDAFTGVAIAGAVILAWLGHLAYALECVVPSWTSPWLYAHLLAQTYFFTGLFITAHDAMHGSIARSGRVNRIVGRVCSFLFAGLSYTTLTRKHRLHHEHPGTELDPDYSPRRQTFLFWWALFLSRYVTLPQLVLMAAWYNLLALRYLESAIIAFWMLPALLATLQLFLFGTYLPHRPPHTEAMQPHRARSQRRNHVLALLSCYFFGYHWEHHEWPGVPWWKLAAKRG